MEETFQAIIQETKSKAEKLANRSDYEILKASVLGGKGSFTEARKGIGKLPKEERPTFGKRLNEVKTELEAILASALEIIEQAEIAAKLGPPIDPTLPSPDPEPGTLHPLTQTREKLTSIFRKIGFTAAEGPEIETDYFCFDALNIPADHPARDMQDTYFLPDSLEVSNVSKKEDEPYLLRTHTSPVQIRTMLNEPLPLRIISPGRCFRRDTVDATHSANFHQIEGLYVDENVTLKELKATLDYFVQSVFGKGAETRLRPSFFPFTEPSYEMDFRSPNLGKLSNRWLEIMGCGMVDPEVFKAVGIDPDRWTGFAFGMGIERIAMITTGVDDIRHFYQNDLRFLRQFA